MPVTVELYVYVVKDSWGNVWAAAVSKPEDTIHIYGVKDRDHWLREFDAESFRLPAWCIEHGFQCVVTKRTIEVEFPE